MVKKNPDLRCEEICLILQSEKNPASERKEGENDAQGMRSVHWYHSEGAGAKLLPPVLVITSRIVTIRQSGRLRLTHVISEALPTNRSDFNIPGRYLPQSPNLRDNITRALRALTQP